MSSVFDDLEIGATAETSRLCREEDLIVFANASGNFNPLTVPDQDGDGDGVPEAVAPAMWVASLISSVLGNKLPGPGMRYRAQSLFFRAPVLAGETVVARVKLLEKKADRVVRLETIVETQGGRRLLDGEAEVIAPETRIMLDAANVPGLLVQRHVHFERMILRAEPLPPFPTAVVAPEEPDALAGTILGAEHTLITPLLIGDPDRIAAAAAEKGIDLAPYEIIAEPHHKAAAACAVRLVHEGRAKAIMKGHLHTDVLLSAILKKDGGLRGTRRLSHVFVMDVPGLDHPLFISDAAINIAPDLKTKADITQNAIDLALAIGVTMPKVGILSAVETVNPAIPSTLDAAILSKMAERGQITGGLVDGPLAMDNAVDLAAARTKGIISKVAGQADILIVPNMEAGNMLAKQLTYLAHADAGGIVMGAQCPVILNSRADNDKARLASCAIAALLVGATA
ncbi:bifunctional enoyl-CoA hydratase/phosphate acetyltransferase [Dinoroseobacter shibae]|jgi:phosphate butyryltransferase|nr:bifunctional enoyl-CoA hydratase/phosphate acetyltransferase [Dinoroseobacter shibae]URF47325.1 bifunctional enoyl-CoA hydratase/phosphate acetyltransferase [Dinoroseobacter shibae]URF51636.1 bifunctional enoyl-CoA hydratase/phosphate acetyltransferase [Dinoroseobacter shibae]